MTDLQVKYQTLQEQKRANLEQEKMREKDVTSQNELRSAQTTKINAELPKITAEIKKILADSDLTAQKKETEVAKSVEAWISTIISPLTQTAKAFGDIGKGASSLFKL